MTLSIRYNAPDLTMVIDDEDAFAFLRRTIARDPMLKEYTWERGEAACIMRIRPFVRAGEETFDSALIQPWLIAFAEQYPDAVVDFLT